MSDYVFGDEFWEAEATRLHRSTSQTLFEIFWRGGEVGSKALPESARILLDWDIFSDAALTYLDTYRLSTVPGITETIRNRATNVIQKWIQGGEPLSALIPRIAPIVGPERARRIAVTEVTRAYAGGNIAAWKTSNLVTAKVWQTARDERVCPICGPLHNQVVSIDSSFQLNMLELPPELARSGMDFLYYQPPAHPNCRCWLKPVVTEAKLREGLREALMR